MTKRFALLVLSALLALGLLAGCAGAADSTSRAEASFPGSQTIPSGETNAAPLTDPADAFASCLGWGPGTAGTSLKSVRAAVSMMDWAAANRLDERTAESVSDCFRGWYEGLEAFQQEGFAEAWPLIRADAQALLEDPDALSALLEDAGLDPKNLPACSAADWEALQSAADGIVPQVQGEA